MRSRATAQWKPRRRVSAGASGSPRQAKRRQLSDASIVPVEPGPSGAKVARQAVSTGYRPAEGPMGLAKLLFGGWRPIGGCDEVASALDQFVTESIRRDLD